MTQYDRRRVQDVGCPKCGAEPGDPCVTRTGRRFTGDHHIHRRGVVYPSFLLDAEGRPKRGIAKIGGA